MNQGSATWEGAEIINDSGGLTYGYHQVSVDSNGNAFAVWMQQDGNNINSIYANRYDSGSATWGDVWLINAGNNNAGVPQVAADSNGNAFVVWEQLDGTSLNIYANRYDSGSATWEGAEIIDAGDNGAAIPQVAVDSNGNAFVVWAQYDGAYDNIYANRYDSGSATWEGAEIIDAGDNGAAIPQVAVDSNGTAFVVWAQYVPSAGNWDNIYANRYDTGSATWEGAEIIDASDNAAGAPQVAVDSNGNAFAVWEHGGGTYNSIYANLYN
jgi:predicted enzyme related to lactoylglutathione lyase